LISRDSEYWRNLRADFAAGKDIRFRYKWDAEDEAEVDYVALRKIASDKDSDEIDHSIADLLSWRALGFAQAKRCRTDTVPIQSDMAEDMAEGLMDDDVLGYLCQHVDPQQVFDGKEADRDDIVTRLIPWVLATEGREEWETLAGAGLLWAMSRMISQWPDEDVARLEPLLKPMGRIWQRLRAIPAAAKNPAHSAVRWDLIELAQMLGRKVRGAAIIAGPEARAMRRLKVRVPQAEREAMLSQYGSAVAAMAARGARR